MAKAPQSGTLEAAQAWTSLRFPQPGSCFSKVPPPQACNPECWSLLSQGPLGVHLLPVRKGAFQTAVMLPLVRSEVSPKGAGTP